MTSIRRAELPSDNFTMISNTWFRDRKISMKAAGLRDWLASHKVGFKVSEKTIISAFTDGRESVRTAIRELESLGYLVRVRERLGGKFSTVEYILCDPPKAPTATTDGNPVDGESSAPRTGIPSLDVTSIDATNPKVSTNDGIPDDGFHAPLRRTTTQKTRTTKKTNDENPALDIAVGVDTARTERDAVTTPPAISQDFSRLAGDVLGKLPAHYRDAPAWLRSRMLTRIEKALHAGNSPAAVIAYAAKFAADPNFGAYEHLRQFADAVRKLTVDVSEGITCPGCGLDSRHPFCTANVAGGF